MRSSLDEAILEELTFAAFDLETTGIDPLRDKIVEIGVALFKKREIQQTVEILVNPGIPIPRVALAIHGIDDSMVANQPRLSEVLPEIFPLFSGKVPLAHNASFDLSFLLEGAREQRLPFSSSPVIDSCILARHVFPEMQSHRLQFLVKALNLECDQSHRALSDAKSCFSLFCKVVEKLPLQWQTPWEEFSSKFPGIFSMQLEGLALPERFSPFESAIQQRQRLLVSYQDGQGQVTEREITPIGVALDERQRMVMHGYCHLRQSTRTFRLDRIMDISLASQ